MLALHDANVVQMEWAESAYIFADLFTKILEAGTFTRLRDQIKVFRSIPGQAGDEGAAEGPSAENEFV